MLLALALAAVLLIPEAFSGSFELKKETGPSSAGLELVFKENMVAPTRTIDKRELLLQFDRAVDAPAMDDLTADMRDWIAWISTGYDTLLIHAARDLQFNVSMPAPDRIVIEMVPVETRKAEGEASIRLAILKSRLLNSTGRPSQAGALLHGLLLTHPSDGQALSALADFELQNGRWRQAVDLYSRALVVQPRNEDLAESPMSLSCLVL